MFKNLTPEQINVVKKCTTGVAVSAIVIGIILLCFQSHEDELSEGENPVSAQNDEVVWADSGVSYDLPPSHPPASTVIVDIGGAVKRPGIYRLNQNSRLADLLELTGGFVESDVHRAYLLKDLNLALILQDGAKYYIPFITDSLGDTSSNLNQISAAGDSKVVGLISINSASQASLDTLPGIGTARSKQIIDGRPYQTLDELVVNKILGQKTFDGLKDLISL